MSGSAPAVDVPVQVGGGLRQADAVEAVLAAGAARVVLGTAALADPALIEALVAEHGERIVVAADARAGRVAVEGWERETRAAHRGASSPTSPAAGVRRFVYTPVEVDGTLRGPALDGLGGRRGSCGDRRRADLLRRSRDARPPADARRRSGSRRSPA